MNNNKKMHSTNDFHSRSASFDVTVNAIEKNNKAEEKMCFCCIFGTACSGLMFELGLNYRARHTMSHDMSVSDNWNSFGTMIGLCSLTATVSTRANDRIWVLQLKPNRKSRFYRQTIFFFSFFHVV